MDLIRNIDTSTLAAMDTHFNPIIAVFINWPTGSVRAHSGVGDLLNGGNTFTGVGEFGEVSVPGDGFGAVPGDAVLKIVGLAENVLELLDDDIRNRRGIIYFGAVTEPAGNVLVGNLTPIFDGRIDASRYITERVDIDGQEEILNGAEITLSGGGSMRSSAVITHSYEDQISKFPGDTAGRHVQYAVRSARQRTWPE